MYKRLIAFFLLIVLCLTSCAPSGAQESNSQSTEASGTLIEPIQFNGSKVIDAYSSEQGIEVFIENEGKISCMTLDSSLKYITQKSVSLSGIAAVCADAEAVYYLAGEGIYKNSELLYEMKDEYYVSDSIAQLLQYDGSIFCCSAYCLYRDGEKIALPADGENRYVVRTMLVLKDKLYAVLTAWSDSIGGIVEQWLCPLDSQSQEIHLQDGVEFLFEQEPEYTCTYQGAAYFTCGTEVFRFDGETVERLCNVASQGVDSSSIRRILMLSDEQLLIVQRDGLLPVSLQGGERPTLCLGVYKSSDYYEQTVAAFNRSGAAFAVEARKFSSVEKLNLAIVNGEIDLVATDEEDILQNYAAKGLLRPYDEKVLAKILPNVVQAASYQGTCYYLPLTVGCAVSTITDAAVGDTDMGTLEEVLKLIEDKCSYCFKKETRAAALEHLIIMYRGSWLNRQKQTVCFNSDSFVEMLEFCKKYAASSEEIERGETAADVKKIQIWENALSVDSYASMQQDDPVFGTPAMRFFLFPLENCEGECVLSPSTFYCAVRNEQERFAQEFLAYLFADETDCDTLRPLMRAIGRRQFSVNRVQCEEKLRQEESNALSSDGIAWEPEEITRNYRNFNTLLQSGTRFMATSNDDIGTVIKEEAAAYFNDDCTAREAAERIQERVSIYLAEQN